MKSLLSLTALLLSSVLSYAFEVDGIAYNITSEDDLTVEVARKSYYSGIIVIPERVTYEGNDYTVTSISDIAFYECSLTSLTIPSSVTSIGKMAFYKCGLTSLTIPSSVTSIGDRAFGGCGGLTSVTIPSSVTSISKGVFQGCGGLTSLTIPSGVTSIGDEAFQGCSGLTSLTIPSSVTSIGWYAFYGCSGLTSLTIPSSVTSIGRAAFYRCSRLTSVTIPEGVTTIGDEAFSNCLSLTSVKIPSRVTSIGERVFEGCSGLTSLTIPSSVTSIGVHAFENCRGLTSIVVEDGNTVYDSRDNCNAIVRTSDNTLIAGCKNTVIPSSVTSIGECTFASCRGLTSVTIPEGVTSIGRFVFQGCSGLTSVIVGWEIPLEIDGSIFEYSNYNNATLYVPKGTKAAYEAASVWKDFGEVREIFDKSDGALSDSQGIRYTANDDESTCYVSGHDDNYVTGIVIPNIFNGRYVTSIGAGAFSGCSNLTFLTVERNTPIAVDGSAFEGSNYRDITLRVPIGSKAVYDTAEGWSDFGEISEWFDGADGEVVDAQGVKYTANDDETTCYVSGHESNYSAEIVIPEVYGGRRVTSIDDQAFQDCSGLTSVTISEGVTSIDDYAFSGCSGLTSVTIPEGVRRIRYRTFQGCSSLTSVTIPSSVSWFGGYAFSGCSGLTSVTISEGVTSIGAWNFENCSSLTSVTIPSSVGGIGIGAFSGCSSLTSVTISEGVTSIGVSAFQSCSSLTSIVVEEGNTVYDSRDNCNAIIRTDDNTLIAGCKNTFIPSSVTSIGVNAFSGSGLTSVTIPSSVTSIGGGAFFSCRSLKTVTVGWETPLEIATSVFEYLNYNNATLYVPKGTKAAYEAAAVWQDFGEILESEVSTDDQLVVDEVIARKGKTIAVDIGLTNKDTNLTAYQFDLTLPAGFTLAMNGNKYQVTKTARYEDDQQALNVSAVEGREQTYRFVSFSQSNSVITQTSGAILNTIVEVADDVEPGTYEAQLSAIVFTKADGMQVKLNNVKFNFVVNNVTLGDANDDGDINVSDIVEIVNCIMEKPSSRFVAAAADLNEDGEVNVTDIVQVVNIIMSAGSAGSRSEKNLAVATDNDMLMLTDGCSLRLENESGYVAAQFDLTLNDGQTLDGISLNGERSGRHLLTYTKTGENEYKVILYSLNNSSFSGHSGELLNIRTSGRGDIVIDNILFVTSGNAEKRFAPLYGTLTGIETTQTSTVSHQVYDLQGRRTKATKKGVYIVNGKKQVVR